MPIRLDKLSLPELARLARRLRQLGEEQHWSYSIGEHKAVSEAIKQQAVYWVRATFRTGEVLEAPAASWDDALSAYHAHLGRPDVRCLAITRQADREVMRSFDDYTDYTIPDARP